MNSRISALFVGLLVIGLKPLLAFTEYRPLGGISGSNLSVGDYHPVRESDLVKLPGLRPPEAELLKRTLEQRYRRSLAATPNGIARRAVPKIFRDGPSFARARGIYAELRYAQNNPFIGKVYKANAEHHDLYLRPRWQRPPFGIQVKTHGNANPQQYASDMVKDHRARWFVIPDDHVEGVQKYWREQGAKFQAQGNTQKATDAYKAANRVKPLGATSEQLRREMERGGRILIREANARYVSLGAAIALAGLPAIYSVTTEGYFSEQAAWRLGNAVAIGSGAMIVNHALAKYKGGALQGTLRGNAITCLVLVGVDTGYAFVEFGGTKAFNRPEFYERLGGGLGATALGFAVGTPVATYTTALAAETGPCAPVIGGAAGVVSGMAAGALGYVGGEKVTRFGLTIFAPKMLLESDLSAVRSARGELEVNLAQLSAP